jgi:hypothetical protein
MSVKEQGWKHNENYCRDRQRYMDGAQSPIGLTGPLRYQPITNYNKK